MHKARVIAREADEPTKEALPRDKRSIHSAYKALRHPHKPSNGKSVVETSIPMTIKATLTPVDPPPQLPMAKRMIDLAGTMLEELASWRPQFPQALTVLAFGLMEKHLHELQTYFGKKHGEMREGVAWVESHAVSADIPTEADSVELAPIERTISQKLFCDSGIW
jgi:hypothetical protein